MSGFPILSLGAAILSSALPQSYAQPSTVAAAPVQTGISYARTADLALASPLVVDGVIRSAVHIKGQEAAGVAPGNARFYVEIAVNALIRGNTALAPEVGYVVDVPLDARGRPPKLKDMRVIVFARPVAGRPAQLQLVGDAGQQPWSPALDRMVRAIITEAVKPDAPPAITGIGSAFHVPGTIPGEGETQIFLNTAGGAPISLSILTRPGQDRRWSVSLGDIVNDSAGPARPDTLLWYRLACGLPAHLPESALTGQAPDNSAAAREDYQFVLNQLGPCGLNGQAQPNAPY